MGLGLLWWASLICFTQFNGTAGFPAPQVYTDDEVQSAAEQPEVVPAEPILPYEPHAPEDAKFLNDEPIDWAPEEFDNIPLSPEYLIQRQFTSLEVAPSNSRLHAPRSADGSTPLASESAYYGPYTSQDDSWQPEAVDGGSAEVNLDDGFPDTGSSADRGDWHNHRLVFEEVFHYPSEKTGSSHLDYGTVSNTAGSSSQVNYKSNGFSTGYAFMLDDRSLPSYQVKEGELLVSGLKMQRSFPSSFSGEENLNYQVQNDESSSRFLQQQHAFQKTSQREAQQIPYLAQNYLQLGDGYQQGRYILNKSWRSPKLPLPVAVGSENFKRDDTRSASHPQRANGNHHSYRVTE